MTDPFAAAADLLMVRPRKARQRREEKRAATLAQNKAEEEAAYLHKTYAKWRKEQLDGMLSSAVGSGLQSMIDYLDGMTLQAAPDLVSRVERATWLREADPDVRFMALRLIDDAIVRLRERHDMPPLDDPLPGEPPSAFLLIREMLR